MKKRNRMFSRYSKASGLAGALLLGVRRFTGVWQRVLSWGVSPEERRKHSGWFVMLSDPLFSILSILTGSRAHLSVNKLCCLTKQKAFVSVSMSTHTTVKEAYLTYSFLHIFWRMTEQWSTQDHHRGQHWAMSLQQNIWWLTDANRQHVTLQLQIPQIFSAIVMKGEFEGWVCF